VIKEGLAVYGLLTLKPRSTRESKKNTNVNSVREKLEDQLGRRRIRTGQGTLESKVHYQGILKGEEKDGCSRTQSMATQTATGPNLMKKKKA